MQGAVEFDRNCIIVRGAFEIKDVLTIRGYSNNGNETRFSLDTSGGIDRGKAERFKKELHYLSRIGYETKQAEARLERTIQGGC